VAFSYDPTNNIGKCRLYCYDITDGIQGTDYIFSDADIQAFLDQNSDSIWLSSADACRVLAVKAIPTAYLLELTGALKLDKKKVAALYLALAQKYEQRATSSSDTIVEFVDSYDLVTDILGRDLSEYVGD